MLHCIPAFQFSDIFIILNILAEYNVILYLRDFLLGIKPLSRLYNIKLLKICTLDSVGNVKEILSRVN